MTHEYFTIDFGPIHFLSPFHKFLALNINAGKEPTTSQIAKTAASDSTTHEALGYEPGFSPVSLPDSYQWEGQGVSLW